MKIFDKLKSRRTKKKIEQNIAKYFSEIKEIERKMAVIEEKGNVSPLIRKKQRKQKQ